MDELGPVVTGALDGGNIELVGSGMVGTQHEFHLKIRPDPFTKHTDLTAHCQWFYFKVANVIGMPCHFSIMDLLKSSYPGAWPGYKIAYSYDMNDWFRVHNTDYDVTLGVLSWTVTPVHDQIFFAYFAPYSYARHLELIAQCSSSTLSTVKVIGHTLDHRFLELVVCGTGPVPIWINARQHPGETMAEWFMEGLIERLLDPVDPVSIQLRSLATLYCVPNMNPDGSVRGHLRTNAGGANLNREWASNGNYVAPSLERSPEVYYVLKAMDAVGCRMFVDVHGDEEIPANFVAGTQGIPSWNSDLENLLKEFKDALCKASPDFQTVHGYGDDEANQANLSVCADQIAHRFGCLAVTLEQPFKDTTYNTPMANCGWSPQRAKKLGSAMLDAIFSMLPKIEK